MRNLWGCHLSFKKFSVRLLWLFMRASQVEISVWTYWNTRKVSPICRWKLLLSKQYLIANTERSHATALINKLTDITKSLRNTNKLIFSTCWVACVKANAQKMERHRLFYTKKLLYKRACTNELPLKKAPKNHVKESTHILRQHRTKNTKAVRG